MATYVLPSRDVQYPSCFPALLDPQSGVTPTERCPRFSNLVLVDSRTDTAPNDP